MYTFTSLLPASLTPVLIHGTENKHLRFISFSQVKRQQQEQTPGLTWAETDVENADQVQHSATVYVHSIWVHNGQIAHTLTQPLCLWMDRVREQVSKIEMYKKSMNNNYRGSVFSGLCDTEGKPDFLYSVWSCGVPFFHPCFRFSFFFFTVPAIIYVWVSEGPFSAMIVVTHIT